MKKRYGFTLSEILLSVGILGLLIAIVTPAIVKVSPSSDKIMARQAYYTATSTVSNMINNPLFYKYVDETTGIPYKGFDDHTKITYKGKNYEGVSKFADLFISHLNYKGSVSTNSSYCGAFAGGNGCRTVTTTSGPRWSLYIPLSSNELAAQIMIDLNGDKGPNCYSGKSGDVCNDPDVVYDQFRMNIFDDGKVIINPNDDWAAQAIKSTGTFIE